MIIATFDLATATGVCDGRLGGKPRLWSWYLRDGGDGRGARFAMLAEFLARYFGQEPCDAVAYEAPMPLGMLNSSAKKGRKGFMMSEDNVAFARGAIGVLELQCYRFKKPVEALSAQDARQSVLGWRTNRDKSVDTKKRVMTDVVDVLGVPAETDNEADAFVLWKYKCNLLDPRLAVAQTPLFRENYPP